MTQLIWKCFSRSVTSSLLTANYFYTSDFSMNSFMLSSSIDRIFLLFFNAAIAIEPVWKYETSKQSCTKSLSNFATKNSDWWLTLLYLWCFTWLMFYMVITHTFEGLLKKNLTKAAVCNYYILGWNSDLLCKLF